MSTAIAASLRVLQFEGGQSNPTFHITDGGGRMYVLRKKPPGKLLPSAHQVDREYRVIKALSDHTDVPVPKPYALCQDDGVIGTAFYIMEFTPGRVLADPRMPGISPADRAKIFDSMNDVLARIHNVDYRAVGLGDFGREGQYIQRQISRWSSQYDLARTEHIEAMEQLKQWLPANIPPGDETRINHGDYRLGNTIVHPTEPRIVAVLDWELSTLGHPLADLGYNCMMYHFGEGFGASGGYAGLDLKAFGIPSEAEYLAAYARRTGRKDSAVLRLLPRLLAVPPRRHRAGRLQARARRQRLVGDRHQVRQPRQGAGRHGVVDGGEEGLGARASGPLIRCHRARLARS